MSRNRRVLPCNDLCFLLEEKDPGVPALACTKNFDVNCLAPKYGNDVLL